MKRATILLAAVLAAGMVSVTIMAPPAEAKKSSKHNNDTSGPIQNGMTLDEAQQAVNGTATPVGGPNNGVQTYRISVRTAQQGGGTNDHPVVTVYMFGVKDGKVTWVRKQA